MGSSNIKQLSPRCQCKTIWNIRFTVILILNACLNNEFVIRWRQLRYRNMCPVWQIVDWCEELKISDELNLDVAEEFLKGTFFMSALITVKQTHAKL